MDFTEAREMAWEVQKKLEEKHGEQSPYRMVTELVEEVGEIAEAVKAREGVAGKEHAKGKIGAELADALYSILTLASYYNTDLEKDFEKVINGIKQRYL